MVESIKVTNNVYSFLANAETSNVYDSEFFGWHLDGNRCVFRDRKLGTSRRTYIDMCIDANYILCDASVDNELFEKLFTVLSSADCTVKKQAFRKKSNQLVMKVTNIGYGTFIDVITSVSTYKLAIEQSTKKKASSKRKTATNKRTKKAN